MSNLRDPWLLARVSLQLKAISFQIMRIRQKTSGFNTSNRSSLRLGPSRTKRINGPEDDGLIRRGPGRLKAIVESRLRVPRADAGMDPSKIKTTDRNDFMRISGSEVSSRKLAQCLLLGQRVIVGQLEKCKTTTWFIASPILVLN